MCIKPCLAISCHSQAMNPAHAIFHNRHVLRAKRAQQFADAGFINRANLMAQRHGTCLACRGHRNDQRRKRPWG